MSLILLTGATGFVGRQVLRVLGERGCRVRAVVREGKQHLVVADSVVASADIFAEGEGWWEKACEGVDTVIHGAWYVEPGQYLQSPKNRNCLAGTLRLAQGAIAGKVGRFVGIGTCFEYDLDAGHLSIATPLRPATLYASAKVEAFSALSQLLPSHGVSFAWCRLFYLYGEGENPRRLVSHLRARLSAGEHVDLGRGTQLRDYLDVLEAARMIVDTALGSVQGPVNICSEKPVTIRALAERIADEYGRRDLLRFGVRPDNLTDPPVVVGVRNGDDGEHG